MAQSLRRGGRVAQEADVSAVRAEVLFKLAPVEQSHIGVLPITKPLQYGRQQNAVDLRRTGHSGCQCDDMAHGRVGIGESDGFETLLRGLRRQSHLFVVQPGVDRQHGPVVDVHVQVTHLATGFVVFVDEFLRMHMEGACQATQFKVLAELVDADVALALDAAPVGLAQIGEQVGALERPHLLPMLQHAFEAIIPRELLRLFARDVSAFGQRAQRFEGGAGAQRLIGPPVHQLQHLHGELDIAQASPAEFDLTVLERFRNEVLDAFAHLLAVIDEIVAFGRRPDEWTGHVHVGLAESRIAGDGTRLEQRLKLPVLRPLLVICLMRIEPPHQRAVFAFRPQSSIDLPQRRFGDAHDDGLAYTLHRGRHFGADAVERHAVGFGIGGLHHINQVNIGNVIEFPGAEFAHADDGKAYMFAALHLVAGDGQGPFEGRVGEIGQFLADARLYFDGVGGGGVLRHDGRQLFAVCSAQRGRGVGKRHAGLRHGHVVGIGPHRFQHMVPALTVVVQMAFARVVGRGFDEFGTEPHEFAHFVGNAENGDEPHERVRVGDDAREIPALTLHHFDDVHKIAQRHVGIACLLQRRQQQTQPAIIDAVIMQFRKQRMRLVEILQPRPNQIERPKHVRRSHGSYSNHIFETA